MIEEGCMSRIVSFRAAFASLAAPAILALTAAPTHAQAWVPAKGEGTVSIVLQDTLMRYHYMPTTPYDFGHMRGDALLVDVTYGLTDKVAVSIGIPWVASKYNGPFPHPLASDLSTPNPIDDGTYHSTFQDFRFDVRYNITRKGMVVTPFAGSIMPSHDYTSFAHAAPGRNLRELQVGVSAAKLLDSLVPGLFVQGRYAYGFTETVIDISHNRSMMELELGYFVTPRLRVLALGNSQITHGGLDYTPASFVEMEERAKRGEPGPALVLVHHDQVDRINSLNVGGGASYALSERFDMFGSLIHTVAARNGHALSYGATIGVSWSFSTARSKDRAIARSDRSLAKCLCGKTAS
jgi:hypothetical protein